MALAPLPASAQKVFQSPETAMNAFGNAIIDNDDDAVKALLGANYKDLIPPVGAELRYRFIEGWAKSHALQHEGDSHAVIAVGNDGWTMPIPLVKSAAGWRFDTRAGAEEMRLRRIGRNELAVMQAMLALCDAQREYAAADHDGDGLLAYAPRLWSSSGKQDGLYWPTKAGEQPSPLGRAFAAAGVPSPGSGTSRAEGYHGYHYKLLTSQGAHAKGGALDYVARGKLFGGFGVIAWPVRYGDTGVMSFIVNHDGQVYEQDLGPDSASKGALTKSFDPGPGWRKVSP
jgi:hypothetical protein